GEVGHRAMIERRARPIRGVALGRAIPVIDGEDNGEPGLLEPQVQTPAAGEQADTPHSPAVLARWPFRLTAGGPPRAQTSGSIIRCASSGGTALPICLTLSRRFPAKRYAGGNV